MENEHACTRLCMFVCTCGLLYKIYKYTYVCACHKRLRACQCACVCVRVCTSVRERTSILTRGIAGTRSVHAATFCRDHVGRFRTSTSVAATDDDDDSFPRAHSRRARYTQQPASCPPLTKSRFPADCTLYHRAADVPQTLRRGIPISSLFSLPYRITSLSYTNGILHGA